MTHCLLHIMIFKFFLKIHTYFDGIEKFVFVFIVKNCLTCQWLFATEMEIIVCFFPTQVIFWCFWWSPDNQLAPVTFMIRSYAIFYPDICGGPILSLKQKCLYLFFICHNEKKHLMRIESYQLTERVNTWPFQRIHKTNREKVCPWRCCL